MGDKKYDLCSCDHIRVVHQRPGPHCTGVAPEETDRLCKCKKFDLVAVEKEPEYCPTCGREYEDDEDYVYIEKKKK